VDADLVLWMRLYVPLIGGVALAVGLLVLRPPPTRLMQSNRRSPFDIHSRFIDAISQVNRHI
jgi:hypothetical protein